ncbi:tripartite tricarboxylate transporter substrate-binding protein [Sediminicoccus sp. KRV36]|uniref:Bug family tripartite tricarboxylate transporter substrate binding protein n=1 Tax=Sediminicoccus sp. KRV36 TaxID=3133721 RepID=UPI00200BF03D|nr:tripartite tricarboxylate transporter substrate-binding protein [Sediminicoccus rosea]UPY35174.1 tripartite tricarboxylate transporter substrate binding protein [Sediminicoccus rosea]
MTITRRSSLALLVAPTLAAPGIARAQSGPWPNRPIRMIVPFGTGGGSDITMRLLAPKIAAVLGQNVIVENRPGAGSTVGTDFVAKSAPDGYNFVLATLSSTGLAVGLYRNLPYDPVRDLTAISPTNFIPICHTVTTRGLQVRDTADWIAQLRAQPNRFSYGSSGVGSSGHIGSASFLAQTGTTAVHVPYRGGGQVYAALIAGDIQFTSDIPSQVLPFHRDGQARTLFVATDERSTLMPEVPTAAEVGLPNYKSYSWFGIFGPPNLPPAITERMWSAIDQALADPDVARRFNEMGTPAMRGYSPARFAQFVRDEIALWVPIVRASGATAD